MPDVARDAFPAPEEGACRPRHRRRPLPHGASRADHRAGLDCSAFTQLAYNQVLGVNLPRTTESQANIGQPVDRYRLQHGDLVFFKTGWQQYHVGVYTGAGEFIHASTSKGVIRSRLDNVYWNSRYWQARRLTQ